MLYSIVNDGKWEGSIEWKKVSGRKNLKLFIYDGRGRRCEAGMISPRGAEFLEGFMERALKTAYRIPISEARKGLVGKHKDDD